MGLLTFSINVIPASQPIQFKNANLSRLKPLRVLISTDFPREMKLAGTSQTRNARALSVLA
jgi:hypothetical protein